MRKRSDSEPFSFERLMEPMDLNPANYSPHQGCALPLRELQKLRPKILDMSIEEQAEVADAICKRYGHRQDFANMQVSTKIDLDRWNATSVGNAAFMALHAHDSVKAVYRKNYDDAMKILRLKAQAQKQCSLM